ncbi:10248_t:CDS:1, partial [Scutellospora calospora]
KDFERNGAPSQESVKAISAEEAPTASENENIVAEIISESEEQTIIQDRINSIEVNNELFGV